MTTNMPEHRSISSIRPIRRGALLIAGAMVLSACGGPDGGSGVASLDDAVTTTAPTAQDQALTTEEAALGFTQCLRDQGIDAPDPTFAADGSFALNLREIFGGGAGGGAGPSDEVRTAMEACSEYVEAFRQGFDQVDRTELQDNLLAFAECMRSEGIDMADPDLSGGISAGGPGGFLGDLDLSDPTVSAALETCQTVFGGTGPGGFRIGGGGPGGPPPSINGGSDN
jgi:hypothetical protein